MGTTVGAYDAAARARLCQYLLRPPISDDRLTALPDGRVSLALKTPWRDGTVCIVLTATQLVARLAALVPRPGQNLVRYHGVLAANAKDRAAIVPGGARPAPSGAKDADVIGPKPLPPLPRNNGRYLEWAALMLRAFEIRGLHCPCGGRLRLVAMVMDGAGAARYLRGTGLGTPNPLARPPLTPWLDPTRPRRPPTRPPIRRSAKPRPPGRPAWRPLRRPSTTPTRGTSTSTRWTRARTRRADPSTPSAAHWEWPPWLLLTGQGRDLIHTVDAGVLSVYPNTTVPTRDCRAFTEPPFARCRVSFDYAGRPCPIYEEFTFNDAGEITFIEAWSDLPGLRPTEDPADPWAEGPGIHRLSTRVPGLGTPSGRLEPEGDALAMAAAADPELADFRERVQDFWKAWGAAYRAAGAGLYQRGCGW